MNYVWQDGYSALGVDNSPHKQVGVYMNRKAVVEDRFSVTDDDNAWRSQMNFPLNEIYRVDNPKWPASGILGEHSWDKFDTDIVFHEKTECLGKPWRQPLFGYPLDHWEASLVVVANDYFTATNQSRGGSYVLPILNATLSSSTCESEISKFTITLII